MIKSEKKKTAIFWAMVMFTVIIILSSIVTFGIGVHDSSECDGDCKTGRSLMIASWVFYIMAVSSLNFTTYTHPALTNILFIIATLLFGIGAEKGSTCIGGCKTGINLLIAANSLMLIGGFLGYATYGGSKMLLK